MMHLPKFEDANPTVDYLHKEQSRLQEQARKMLDQTKLQSILDEYGDVQLGGSYAYDLKIYPDLDFGILVEKVTRQSVGQLVGALSSNTFVHKIAFTDLINFPELEHAARIKGFWIGVEVPFEEDIWGLDVVVQQKDWSNPDTFVPKMKAISEDQRDTILALKYDLIRRGLYGSKYNSGQLYDGVLEHGVKDFESLKKLTI